MSKDKNILAKDDKEDDTMAAIANNFVYEIKANNKAKEEKTVTKSFLAMCKEVSKKYPKK